jgi:hypothetical protein
MDDSDVISLVCETIDDELTDAEQTAVLTAVWDGVEDLIREAASDVRARRAKSARGAASSTSGASTVIDLRHRDMTNDDLDAIQSAAAEANRPTPGESHHE